MPTITISGELLAGHKEHAIEVRFDPAKKFGSKPVALRPGRRGFKVRATINGVEFDTAIVGRSKRFWLLIDSKVRKAAGLVEGQLVTAKVKTE